MKTTYRLQNGKLVEVKNGIYGSEVFSYPAAMFLDDIIIIEYFALAVKKACSRETSADTTGWSEENPLWGHCAVVSAAAQDFLGGQIIRASLIGTPFEFMRSHYWNYLPSEKEVDFTKEQFGDSPPVMVGELSSIERILSNEATKSRYDLFVERLNLYLSVSWRVK